jgi:hypothetical protein
MPTIYYFATLKLWKMYSSIAASDLDLDIKKAPFCKEACGDKWTRTTDSRIFSPMLYQLSYITVSDKVMQR